MTFRLYVCLTVLFVGKSGTGLAAMAFRLFMY